MTQFDNFKNTLKELFMLDHAELDFGVYRIMNQKRSEIEDYLDNYLRLQVNQQLEAGKSDKINEMKDSLDKKISLISSMGYDPETNAQVIELRKKLKASGSTEDLENEVYSHLATFFSRYYEGGDFISQRRYKKDVYAIPYEGEEVKLHWANSDQYYIKTGEYFRTYRFRLDDGRHVEFTLKEASTEQNNNLAQNNMERRFAIFTELPVEIVGGELHINFTYELYPKSIKQKDLIVKAYDIVKPIIPADWTDDVLKPAPTQNDRNRTLLQKHFNDYVARNTFDYFIHKDLNGFLSRELDFYIKNEILEIDDIDSRSIESFTAHLNVIKVIRNVGHKLITFLSSLENFQKKLWLKKKMVVQADYCITLDRVSEALYPEIAANELQREEWVRLFAIDEITGSACDGLLFDEQSGYSEPLTVDFLKENPYLVLDTALFPDAFKKTLLQSIDNIDEQCDGLLINSENFQALELLQEKYKEQVKCIYIDPPYNAKSTEILYKNTFKHASWLSMMENRLISSNHLLVKDGVEVVAIDEIEQVKLSQLLADINPEKEVVPVTVVHNPTGQQGYNISFSSEFAIFVYPSFPKKNTLGLEVRENEADWDTRTFRDNSGNNNLRTDAKNCFYPIYVKNNKIIGFGDVCPDAFHPDRRNLLKENEVIEIYPIDNNGVEKKWVFERGTVESILNELWVKNVSESEIDIMRTKKTFRFKSCWFDKKYSANSYGSRLLTSMKIPFDYPKSIYNVTDCIIAGMGENINGNILDYFAGSGTTGHAVIDLNRNDGGHRKYILCEMGEYFSTVTKPRIQKVIYSKDWRDGKPVSREGSSHCFKYMRLEQYEDTLNNLIVQSNATFDHSSEFGESYLLGYMLDTETRDSLFNLEWFRNPWAIKLKITRQNETREESVDLVETFNYLIGLYVDHISYPMEGICTVEGYSRKGEKILVIWRNCDVVDNEALTEFFFKSAYSTRDNEFDRIYVNGDNCLENLRSDEQTWKVTLIEKEFAARMFEED